MGADQQFCLRWNNFHTNITSAFESLRDDEDFVDITLACEGKQVKAHKMVLSACSPYFRNLLKGNPCQHPIVFLKDVTFANLSSILDFMYHGEVNVSHNELATFLKTAEALKVRGLAEDDKKKDTENCTDSNSPLPNKDPPDPGSPKDETSTAETRLSESPPPPSKRRRRSGGSVQSAEDTCETVLSDNRECASVKNEPQDIIDEDEIINQTIETENIKSDIHNDENNTSEERNFGLSESVTISRSQAAMQQLQESFGSFLPGMNQSPGGFMSHGANEISRPPFSMEGVQGLPPGISSLPGPSMSQGASQDSSQGGGEEGHVCRFCGRVCSSRYNLKKHERDLHLNRGAKFTCEICKRQYGSLNSLQVHCSNSHPTGVVRRRHSFNATTYHLSHPQQLKRIGLEDEPLLSQKHSPLSLSIASAKEAMNNASTNAMQQKQLSLRLLSPSNHSGRINQQNLQSPQSLIEEQNNLKLESPSSSSINKINSPIPSPTSITSHQKLTQQILDQNLTAKIQDHIQKASLQYPMQSSYLTQASQSSNQLQSSLSQNSQIQGRFSTPVNSNDASLPAMFSFHPPHFLDFGARALSKGDMLPPMSVSNFSEAIASDLHVSGLLNQSDNNLNQEEKDALDDAVLAKNLMFS